MIETSEFGDVTQMKLSRKIDGKPGKSNAPHGLKKDSITIPGASDRGNP